MMVKMPELAEFEQAAQQIKQIVVQTPLVPLHNAQDVWIKPEIHQVVGSFKIRGVFYAVASLPIEKKKAGVNTVSAGNTAQALAWAANYFGIKAQSIMPQTAPKTKIEAVRSFGATPILIPLEEVFRYLKEHLWEQEPYGFVHPWIDPNVILGHGSIGFEILQQLPQIDSVFIPVGGGGLIAGVASVLKKLKPEIRVFAVEPQGCPSLYTSLEQGKPASVSCKTICDGVAVPYITEEIFPLLKQIIDKTVLISEQEVKNTIRFLALKHKIIAEGSGALATAAALATPQKERGKSVALITGGSIDTRLLIEILEEN